MDARVKLFPLILTKQSPQQPYALFKRCAACFCTMASVNTCKGKYVCIFLCVRKREEDRPVDQGEQQNFPSSTCFISSPINQDPVVTSSWAYIRRIDLCKEEKINVN